MDYEHAITLFLSAKRAACYRYHMQALNDLMDPDNANHPRILRNAERRAKRALKGEQATFQAGFIADNRFAFEQFLRDGCNPETVSAY